MDKIGNVDVSKIAEEFGTPAYVYDKSIIIENYNKLYAAFRKYYPNTKIHYSAKANTNLHILRIIKEQGGGVDCSSPVEFFLAQKAGFDNHRILYTGNYESYEDLRPVAFENLKLNLDDIESFKRLAEINIPELISFRINPGMGRGGHEGITTGGTEAKFGIPYEKAFDAYKLAKDSGVKRFGIHMMTGSNNLEPYFFAEIVDKLLIIAAELFGKLGEVPEYFDIGGGMGVPYSDEEQEMNIDLMAKLVSEVFTERCEKYGFGSPKLILEPGRFLVANAGYLIAKVTGIKRSYKTFAGLDAGMNTLIRPALYGAEHRVSIYNKPQGNNTINLCGQICENSDIFSKNTDMPELETGDLAVFRDAGAYCYAMASNYNNRMRPPEVLIDEGKAKLIRRRETIDDVLALYPAE